MHEDKRNQMVDEQLIPRGIKSLTVLQVFRTVERHEFVPPEFRDASYADHPLPIGEGQTISQPYMVAFMTECLKLTGQEKILEIGTGSGYQAAVLARLAKEVYTVERIPSLAELAKNTFRRLGITNVKVKVDDGTLGWNEHAPYDGIIVTAASPEIPDEYMNELAVGGTLVMPVGPMYSQILTVIEKKKNSVTRRELCGCVFVPLIGEKGWKGIKDA